MGWRGGGGGVGPACLACMQAVPGHHRCRVGVYAPLLHSASQCSTATLAPPLPSQRICPSPLPPRAEAGEGEDGRMKSAIGIGALLMDGLGDTIRVSLTEDPEYEIDPCKRLASLGQDAWTQVGAGLWEWGEEAGGDVWGAGADADEGWGKGLRHGRRVGGTREKGRRGCGVRHQGL